MFIAPLYPQQLYDFLPTIVTIGLSFICVVKPHSQHTIGVEFSSRTVKLGEKRIKLQVCSHHDASPNSSSDSVLDQLWDTAGQERFRSVRHYKSLIDVFRDDSMLLDR
jgi:GTPase SAR1 family protein